MRGGFGATEMMHDREFARRFRDLDESLDAAESYGRNGDCHAMMDEAARAFDLRGQMNVHRDSARMSVRGIHARQWVAQGTRLNFLRQAMKRCVGG